LLDNVTEYLLDEQPTLVRHAALEASATTWRGCATIWPAWKNGSNGWSVLRARAPGCLALGPSLTC
jgi:hypothetical protein